MKGLGGFFSQAHHHFFRVPLRLRLANQKKGCPDGARKCDDLIVCICNKRVDISCSSFGGETVAPCLPPYTLYPRHSERRQRASSTIQVH